VLPRTWLSKQLELSSPSSPVKDSQHGDRCEDLCSFLACHEGRAKKHANSLLMPCGIGTISICLCNPVYIYCIYIIICIYYPPITSCNNSIRTFLAHILWKSTGGAMPLFLCPGCDGDGRSPQGRGGAAFGPSGWRCVFSLDTRQTNGFGILKACSFKNFQIIKNPGFQSRRAHPKYLNSGWWFQPLWKILETHRIFLNSTLVACSDLKSIASSENWPRLPHSIHWFIITFPIIYISAITGEIESIPASASSGIAGSSRPAEGGGLTAEATLRSKCHGIGLQDPPIYIHIPF